MTKVIILFRHIQSFHLGLSNWRMSAQHASVELVLLPEDQTDEIRRVLVDFSVLLVECNDSNWSAWRETSYAYTINS